MSDIIDKQKKFLVDAISDAKRKEFQRLKRIQSASSKSEVNTLTQRFNKERELDQEKIEHLTHDLIAVKTKLADGDLQRVSDYRSGKPSVERRMDKELPNRFEGIENYDQIIFHADIIGKFDRHDQKFQNRQNNANNKFDSLAEHRKLQLLDSKRTLLTKLISVQEAEINAASGGGATGRGYTGRSSGGHNQGRTVFDCGSSVATSSTGESWATFASKTSSRNQGQRPSYMRSNVPKLPLARINEK